MLCCIKQGLLNYGQVFYIYDFSFFRAKVFCDTLYRIAYILTVYDKYKYKVHMHVHTAMQPAYYSNTPII